jgi:hypothetical protein
MNAEFISDPPPLQPQLLSSLSENVSGKATANKRWGKLRNVLRAKAAMKQSSHSSSHAFRISDMTHTKRNPPKVGERHSILHSFALF